MAQLKTCLSLTSSSLKYLISVMPNPKNKLPQHLIKSIQKANSIPTKSSSPEKITNIMHTLPSQKHKKKIFSSSLKSMSQERQSLLKNVAPIIKSTSTSYLIISPKRKSPSILAISAKFLMYNCSQPKVLGTIQNKNQTSTIAM